MAKRKKPENESQEESSVRQALETVADHATRSEKVSWDRKMDNMVAMLAKLKPVEEQILDLIKSKTDIMDEITLLRADMVRDCVHPFTHLVHLGENQATCKFCNKTFTIIDHGK